MGSTATVRRWPVPFLSAQNPVPGSATYLLIVDIFSHFRHGELTR